MFQLSGVSERQLVFDIEADAEGRIAETVAINDANRGCEFELVFYGREYFTGQSLAVDSMVSCVVIRFVMDDEHKRYHLPVMLAPHSYSTWWSS